MSGSKIWIVVALTTFPLLGSLSQWDCCYELFHSCVLLWRTVSSLAVRRLDGFDIVCGCTCAYDDLSALLCACVVHT